MKREIKFRFWTPDKRMLDDHEGWVEGIGINYALQCSTEYGYKIMQYTGLKDKNGKEIYEGDILKREYLDAAGVVNYDMEVLFEMGRWLVRGKTFTDDLDISSRHSELIGNIYENPELIKEQTSQL